MLNYSLFNNSMRLSQFCFSFVHYYYRLKNFTKSKLNITNIRLVFVDFISHINEVNGQCIKNYPEFVILSYIIMTLRLYLEI